MATLYVLGCLSKVVRIIVYIVKFSSSKLTTLNPKSLKPQTLNPEQAVCLVLLAGSRNPNLDPKHKPHPRLETPSPNPKV